LFLSFLLTFFLFCFLSSFSFSFSLLPLFLSLFLPLFLSFSLSFLLIYFSNLLFSLLSSLFSSQLRRSVIAMTYVPAVRFPLIFVWIASNSHATSDWSFSQYGSNSNLASSRDTRTQGSNASALFDRSFLSRGSRSGVPGSSHLGSLSRNQSRSWSRNSRSATHYHSLSSLSSMGMPSPSAAVLMKRRLSRVESATNFSFADVTEMESHTRRNSDLMLPSATNASSLMGQSDVLMAAMFPAADVRILRSAQSDVSELTDANGPSSRQRSQSNGRASSASSSSSDSSSSSSSSSSNNNNGSGGDGPNKGKNTEGNALRGELADEREKEKETEEENETIDVSFPAYDWVAFAGQDRNPDGASENQVAFRLSELGTLSPTAQKQLGFRPPSKPTTSEARRLADMGFFNSSESLTPSERSNGGGEAAPWWSTTSPCSKAKSTVAKSNESSADRAERKNDDDDDDDDDDSDALVNALVHPTADSDSVAPPPTAAESLAHRVDVYVTQQRLIAASAAAANKTAKKHRDRQGLTPNPGPALRKQRRQRAAEAAAAAAIEAERRALEAIASDNKWKALRAKGPKQREPQSSAEPEPEPEPEPGSISTADELDLQIAGGPPPASLVSTQGASVRPSPNAIVTVAGETFPLARKTTADKYVESFRQERAQLSAYVRSDAFLKGDHFLRAVVGPLATEGEKQEVRHVGNNNNNNNSSSFASAPPHSPSVRKEGPIPLRASLGAPTPIKRAKGKKAYGHKIGKSDSLGYGTEPAAPNSNVDYKTQNQHAMPSPFVKPMTFGVLGSPIMSCSTEFKGVTGATELGFHDEASTGTDASSGLDPSRTTAERALALSQRPVRSPRSPAGDLSKERKLKQELKQKTPRVWKKAQAPTPVKAPHRRRQVLYTAELADVPFGAQGVWMPNATLDIPVPMSTEYAGGLTVTTPKALSRSAAREAKEESQIPG
jgi:hypothetical protein